MKKYRLTFLTFGIAVLFNLFICMSLKISPFGENTFIVWDMYWEYSSFFNWIRNVFLGNADWIYSLVGGFGGNTMGLISYFIASPLNLFLLLFDINTIPWAVLFMTLLRTGLMASTMQFYLYSKRKDFFSVLFGCMYALSSYVICYQNNVMWFDALILLPLIVYGLEGLIDGKPGTLYAISLGVSIFSNYYIGYMLCIFSVIYFTGYFFLKNKSFKDAKKIFIKFAFHSAIAGGLSAVMTLPTIYNLGLSSNKHMADLSSLIDLRPVFSYIEFLQYFMAGSFNENQGILGSFPLIYCGIFPLFLVILFFVSKKADARTKIINGLLLAVMLFCMNTQGMYLIWHGCYSPVGSPWRYSFLWNFLFLTIAYYGLASIERSQYKSLLISSGITLAYFIGMFFLQGFSEILVYNFLIIALMFALYYCYNNPKNKYIMAASVILAFLICGLELNYNAVKIHKLQFSGMYEEEDTYRNQIETVTDLLSYISEREASDSIYRTETLNGAKRTYNDGYLYNINTLNMYSSSEKQMNWDLFYPLGFGHITWCADYDNRTTTLSRSIAGIKYFIDSEPQIEEAHYEKIATKNGYTLYSNPSVLPFGFLVNDTALNIQSVPTDNLFLYQNDLYHALIGSSTEDVYTLTDLPVLEENTSLYARIVQQADGSFTDSQNVYVENYELLNQTLDACRKYTLSLSAVKDSEIKGNFLNPTEETAYVCFTIPYEEAWNIKVDGQSCLPSKGMGGFLLVPVTPGEHVIELTYHVPYMALGCCITVTCFIFLIFLRKYYLKHNN